MPRGKMWIATWTASKMLSLGRQRGWSGCTVMHSVLGAIHQACTTCSLHMGSMVFLQVLLGLASSCGCCGGLALHLYDLLAHSLGPCCLQGTQKQQVTSQAFGVSPAPTKLSRSAARWRKQKRRRDKAEKAAVAGSVHTATS